MDIPPSMVYRTLGSQALDRLGAGVMDKTGVSNDQWQYRAVAWSLCLVLRGRGRYVDARGRAFPLVPGWCFQRLPGVPQSTILDPGSRWQEIFIDLGPRLHAPLADMRILPIDPPAWYVGLDQGRIARLVKLTQDLGPALERDLPGLVVRAVALAVEMFSAAVIATERDPVEDACRMLGEALDRRIDLPGWCASQGLDYEKFRKEFRRHTGLPPHRYRIRCRIDRACALLRTGMTVQAVAAELGYPSPFELSAQFTAHMGVPPSRWRG